MVTIDLGEITTTAGPVTRSRRVPPRWLVGAVAAMLVFALTGATPGRPGLVVRWNTAVGVAGFALATCLLALCLFAAWRLHPRRHLARL